VVGVADGRVELGQVVALRLDDGGCLGEPGTEESGVHRGTPCGTGSGSALGRCL